MTKIAVASSVTMFVVTSIMFFTVGFLCGHFCQNKRKTAAGNISHKKTLGTPYVVVLQQHQQEFELKEKVAYGPIQ